MAADPQNSIGVDTLALQTPVVFLIFNRPDLTERVFAAIRNARPRHLHVVADGPRVDRAGEADLCAAARACTEQIDWPCEVSRDYSDVNLGCGKRVSSGITRAFERFEEAVILEDDCLPHPSFFPYCADLPARYRHDERVMAISGDNLQRGKQWNQFSYLFSKYFHCWGWATWRRAWAHYDFQMSEWREFANSAQFNAACPDNIERDHWRNIFDSVALGRVDTWDYQWLLACWKQGGLTAIPSVNLVANIGFRSDATHTRQEDQFANVTAHALGNLKHPPFVGPSIEADQYTFDHVHGGLSLRPKATQNSRVRRFMRYIQRRLFGKASPAANT